MNKKKIVFFPIYLINENIPHTRVGVYEIFMNTLPDVRKEDADIDIDKLGPPLFFLYFHKLLNKINETEKMKMKAREEVKQAIEDVVEEEIDEQLKEQEEKIVEEEAKSELNKKNQQPVNEAIHYNPRLVTNWVQRYFKNNNYGLEDVEKNGNCLFAVIRDAFKTISKDYTVEDLRNMLAKEVTEDIFRNYKSTYSAIFEDFDKLEEELMKIKMKNQKLGETKKAVN